MATASGGFVFKAERSTLDLKSSTGLNVGPGSYGDDQAHSAVAGQAPAPFMSTMERALMENTTTSAITPGPGAYQAAQALDAVQKRHAESTKASAPFVSGTSRLLVDKSHEGKPGPGEYSRPPEWVKHQHRYTAPTAKQRVSYVRVPSAPSIPYRHQCYGYEEGQAGTLVMQPPPDPITTGIGRDTVGPGAYNLVRDLSQSPPRAVQFGKSGTKRGMQVSSITPGPGAYDTSKPGTGKPNGIVVSIAGVDVQFGGASGTSQFASKVPLISQRTAHDWEITPGPGTYRLVQPMGKAPLPAKMQTFGSTAPRSFEVDPLKSFSAPTYYRTPGPAAYNVSADGVKVTQQGLTDAKPFNATSDRFLSSDNGLPGPGEYRPDMVVTLVKAVTDRAAISKGGVFGTTADRWGQIRREHIQAGQLPGPGDYKLQQEPTRARLHKAADGPFASKTQRFQPAHPPPTCPDSSYTAMMMKGEVRGDPQKLGPGSYTFQDPWPTMGKSRHVLASNVPAFGSHSIRNHPSKQLGSGAQGPGPGRYDTTKDVDAAFKPVSLPGKESVFGSQVARFRAPPAFTPGPGHYSLRTDLTRKSFNITFNHLSSVAAN